MLKHRGLLQLLSFALFIFGFTALVMMLLGLNWSFLTWIDAFGRTIGLVLRLLMIMTGIVLFLATNTDWEKEKRESGKQNQ